MAAIIGNAALRAVDEGNGSFETHGREHRAKRLAGLGGVHGERFARKILLAVFGGLRPFANALDFSGIAGVLEQLLLVRQHLLVFRTAEQLEMVEHVVCILRHGGTFSNIVCRSWPLALPDRREPGSADYSAAISVGFGTSFHGALAFFQIGELMAMSISRAKIAKPS